MPLSKETLQASLSRAQQDLAAWEKAVERRNAELKEEDRVVAKKDPKWRHFSAQCASIQARIDAIDAIEKRDADVVARRESADA